MRVAAGTLADWPSQIRRFRRVRAFKQTALAEMVGVDQATVSRWESGRITPEPDMQRRLLGLMRSVVADEYQLRHAAEAAMGEVVLSDEDHVIRAASASYCAAHGVTQSVIIGMSGRPLYREEAEQIRQLAHDSGFYRGDIASLTMVARGNSLCGRRHDIRVKAVWVPTRLLDGTILLRSERRELSDREFVAARTANGGPVSMVAVDDLLA